jgi:flagellar basal-body rod protein FlgC
MSGLKIFDIAGSGMNAQNLRLNLVASNISNANSISSSIDQVYKARHPIFAAEMQNAMKNTASNSGGVNVLGVVESQAPPIMEYQPNNPQADATGYIYKPNVNSIEEMANMMSASRSYQNNIDVMNTAKTMLLDTLKLGQ